MHLVLASVHSLLFGIGVLLVGSGLLGTLLGVRAGLEGFSDATIGLIMAAYFSGFILGTFYCPRLVRTVGHIRAFAAMAAVASATALAHGFLVHPVPWALFRLVTGVCMVGLFMVIESWLNAQATSENRGRVFARYMTVNLVAIGAGQFLILASDVQSLVLFALVSVFFTLGLVPIALTPVSQPEPVEAPPVHLIHLYRVSPLGMAGAAVTGIVSGSLYGLGPVFAQGIGLSEQGIALYMGATVLGGAALQWPVGRLSDRHDRRTVLMGVCFGAAVLALVQFFVVEAFPAGLYACAFFYGGLVLTLYGLSVAHVTDYLSHSELLEATGGLLLVYGVGAAAGPALAGAFMHAFGPASLLPGFAAILGALGLFALYRMTRRPAVPLEEQGEFVPLVRTSTAVLEMHPQAELEPELDLGDPEKAPADQPDAA